MKIGEFWQIVHKTPDNQQFNLVEWAIIDQEHRRDFWVSALNRTSGAYRRMAKNIFATLGISSDKV